ncbi:ATP-binding protein [Streptomyces sp. NPDC060027]|uniref:ATP-binding protein n=1 Tax=Streptomyces sp. NPDC060027 TaxID=3347040 RepID=UPI003681A168
MYVATSEEMPTQAATRFADKAGAPNMVALTSPRQHPSSSGTWLLAHHPSAAGTARRIATAVLNEWHIDGLAADSTVLIVSELVTNAVEHAQPPIALHLHHERVGQRFWIGLTDGGPAANEGAWTASCAEDEHGRGLGIVETLAESYGVHTHSGGAIRWARLSSVV